MEILVLIPGFAFKSTVWNDVAKELFGKYKIIQLDIVSWNPSILYEFLETKIPDNSIICGWSLGGLIATKFCTLFPNKNNRLITIASSPDFSRVVDIDLFDKFQTLLDENIEKFLTKFLYISLYPYTNITNLKYFRRNLVQDYSWLKACLHYLITANVSESYKTLAAKSLHILGGRDEIVSREALYQWKANSTATVRLRSSWGHNPYLYIKELSQVIDRWITQNN